MFLPLCLLVCVFLFALLQERRHTHNNSAVRADFLERRWAPLVAPPAPALARQGGGPGPDPNSASPLGDRRFNDVFLSSSAFCFGAAWGWPDDCLIAVGTYLMAFGRSRHRT